MPKQLPYNGGNNIVKVGEDVDLSFNPDPRCACVLVLDTSGSMAGEPIDRLNDGVAAYADALREDDLAANRVEVAVVACSGEAAEIVQRFVSAKEFNPPILTADDLTPLGSGLLAAVDLIEARKESFKAAGVPYYRPWIVLITDGVATDDANVAAAVQVVRAGEAAGKFAVFGIGVEDADMESLAQLVVRQPIKLDKLKFRELFQWLSASQKSVSQSQPGTQVALQPPTGWAAI